MIENLKDLEKLFKLCRKSGIPRFEIGNIKFELGDLPKDHKEESENAMDGFPTGELTPEQLIFYSAGGLPSDDPALRKAG